MDHSSRFRELIMIPAIRLAPTLIFPDPFSALESERLYAFLDALWTRRDIDGCVLEVGCWLGGTAAMAYRFLQSIGSSRRYVCIDTFDGFVPEQFRADLVHGTPYGFRNKFQANSKKVVRTLLDHWGVSPIELIQGDIVRVPESAIPANITVCLLDVDLEIPIYEGLKRIVPKLAPGGVVLVDDCSDDSSWLGAKVGYATYCKDAGIAEAYSFGFGVVHASG